MAENSAVILQPEVKQVIIPQVTGTSFNGDSIPEAQKLALAYNRQTCGFTAPMPLLLQNFPHPQWYTANSEDLSGIAKNDMPALGLKNGDAYIATAHGGKDGQVGVLLTPEKTELALQLWKDTEGKKQRKGLNILYAAVLDDIYEEKDVMSVLLQEGRRPDNGAIAIYSFQQMLAGETPKDFSPYVVVRPLALAQKTVSGYESIDRLTNVKDLTPLEITKGKETVTDSQVIVYAGGVNEGNNVIKSARKYFISGNVGVWHPFNLKTFNSEQTHGRALFAGYLGNNGLNGNVNLYNGGRLAGVAPEALALLQLYEAPQKTTVTFPPLDILVASLERVVPSACQDELRKVLAQFYQNQ